MLSICKVGSHGPQNLCVSALLMHVLQGELRNQSASMSCDGQPFAKRPWLRSTILSELALSLTTVAELQQSSTLWQSIAARGHEAMKYASPYAYTLGRRI